MDEHKQVGLDSITYHPSKVSWSTSKHIAQENPILSRIFVYILALIILCSVLYCYFREIAVSVSAKGSFQQEAKPMPILSPVDGKINILKVKNNSIVKMGDILAIFEFQLSSFQQQDFLKDKKNLENFIVDEKNGKCFESCLINLKKLSDSSFALTPGFKVENPLNDFFYDLNKNIKSYYDEILFFKQSSNGLIGLENQANSIKKKLRKIESQRAVNLLRTEYDNLKSELLNIESQISDKKNSSKDKIIGIRSQLEVILGRFNQIIKDYVESRQVLASQDGTLLFAEISGAGEKVAARSLLFKIIPNNQPLLGILQIPNKDISKIKLGDRVKMNVDALPEREYGPVWGKIKFIPLFPREEKSSNQSELYVFEVQVELESQSLIDKRGVVFNFKMGMNFQSIIISKYETLLAYGIKKVLNIKDEYLGDH